MIKKAKDLNEENREFWAKRQARTDELLAHLPTAKLAFAEYQMHAEDVAFEDQKPYDFSVLKAERTIKKHADALISVVNSLNASAPRPKNGPDHESIVTEAMKRARRNDYSLPKFLESAAKDGNWDGITIALVSGYFKPGTERFLVRCDKLIPENEEDSEKARKASEKKLAKKLSAAGGKTPNPDLTG